MFSSAVHCVLWDVLNHSVMLHELLSVCHHVPPLLNQSVFSQRSPNNPKDTDTPPTHTHTHKSSTVLSTYNAKEVKSEQELRGSWNLKTVMIPFLYCKIQMISIPDQTSRAQHQIQWVVLNTRPGCMIVQGNDTSVHNQVFNALSTRKTLIQIPRGEENGIKASAEIFWASEE